ncbi:isoprenylcysteine carboxylmethyltransferase family protein [Acidobacteria bacterium AB60]|nr:isoprenylcysteine carboxylmethyltransferase family protein [Acidobacteria bacterium AB60]
MTAPTIFAILYWAWISSEILLQLVTPTTRRRGKLRDRGSLIVLLFVIFASFWIAMQYGESHPRNILGGAHWLRIPALVLLAGGLAVRWAAVFSLGASFSTNVAIHASQKLRTTGLYRLVRHPSYTGMLIIFTAVGLYERNWLSLAVLILFPTAALLYRIHVEEIALTEHFGEQYAEYKRKTRCLIPLLY